MTPSVLLLPGTRLLQTLRPGLKILAMHKLRSTLTITGVVFGVASVIVMLAIAEGARSAAVRQINELGATNIILDSVRPSSAGSDKVTGAVRYGLTHADLRRIATTIPSVASVTPQRAHRRRVCHESRRQVCRIVGVPPAFQELKRLRVRQGRFLSELDDRRTAAVAVLSAEAADALFPIAEPVGRWIGIGEDCHYEVVGVVERDASHAAGTDTSTAEGVEGDIYIPFATDQARFGEVVSFDRTRRELPEIVEISRITVTVDDVRHVRATAEIIDSVLQEHHQKRDAVMTVPLDLLERAERTQRVFTAILGSIAAISLLVGGIGIMNIMLATVTERTREIGIRRAVGAKQNDIMWQFVTETVILSGIGGLIGIGAGVCGAVLLGQFSEMETLVRPWGSMLALAVSLLVGVVFGAYPARHAALMDPVDALRHD